MSVTVEFPDNLVFAAREDPEKFGRDVMVHTLARLYSSGKISAGLAAEILECSRLEFFQLLAERGIPAIDHSESELEEESGTSRELAERIRARVSRA